MKKLDAKRVRVLLAVSFALAVLVALGLAAGVGVTSLSSVAEAYEYSTTITTSTTTTTTTTPTTTKPGKGCGDKNHLHDRRFECKITIGDVSKKEGDSGTTAFVFTVSVSGSPTSTVLTCARRSSTVSAAKGPSSSPRSSKSALASAVRTMPER